jgi:TRAP-type C4-dicarboxylate transport system permease small subunit
MEYAGALSVFLMGVHIVADIIATNMFLKPIPGRLEVVAYYYMIAVVFLPVAAVEIRNEAIAVDLFYDRARPSLKKIMLDFAMLTSLLYFGILFYRSLFDAIEAFNKLERVDGIWIVATWPSRFFLPLGFGAACLVIILRFVNVIFKRRPLSHDENREDY